MINTAIWNHHTGVRTFYNAKKGNAPASPQQELFFSVRQGEPPDVPATCPLRSTNPLPMYTRINGHNIQRAVLPPTMPQFSSAFCTAHLSHEEWMDTLDPEVRRRLDSHGNAEHLAHLSSEERFHIVNSTIQNSKLDEYYERVSQALTDLGKQLGLEWSGAHICNDTGLILAAFECPNGGEGKVVAILPSGKKLFVPVPAGFAHHHFSQFANDIMNELMLMREVSNGDLSAARIQGFLEYTFDQKFPAWRECELNIGSTGLQFTRE